MRVIGLTVVVIGWLYVFPAGLENGCPLTI
jgi:hypothetical protein